MENISNKITNNGYDNSDELDYIDNLIDEIDELLLSQAFELPDEILLKYILNELREESYIITIEQLKKNNSVFYDRIHALYNLCKNESINTYPQYLEYLRPTLVTRVQKLHIENKLDISKNDLNKIDNYLNVLRTRPIIIGLDIGTTKVVAIAGKMDKNNNLEILGYGSTPSYGISHGIVDDPEMCIYSIKSAIKNCLKSNSYLDIQKVYVGIAGKHIKSLQSSDKLFKSNSEEVVNKLDLEDLLSRQHRIYQEYYGRETKVIDIIPLEYRADDLPTPTENPIGMHVSKLRAHYHIIIGNKRPIKDINICVDRAGIEIKDMVLQPLASAAAVATKEDMEQGVAIVDIGGGTTDMAVFHNGTLRHTNVIPYAGINVTKDISTGLKIKDLLLAEELKVKYGRVGYNHTDNNQTCNVLVVENGVSKQIEISIRYLSAIIEARICEILDEVVSSLEDCGLSKRLNAGIILTGGGAKLKGISSFTENYTKYHTRIGTPNIYLASGGQQLDNPKYSTCIGLILRGCYELDDIVSSYEWKENLKENINEKPHHKNGYKFSNSLNSLFKELKGKFVNI